MMTVYERSDLLYIMKMNRLSVSEADTAHLCFTGHFKGSDYEVAVLAAEGLPSVTIKKDRAMIYSETIKSIDDLKIFLDEQLYKYVEF